MRALCWVALEVNQPSGSTFLLEADLVNVSTHLWAYISWVHGHSLCQSRPVIQRWINSLTLLAASFSIQHLAIDPGFRAKAQAHFSSTTGNKSWVTLRFRRRWSSAMFAPPVELWKAETEKKILMQSFLVRSISVDFCLCAWQRVKEKLESKKCRLMTREEWFRKLSLLRHIKFDRQRKEFFSKTS